MPASLTSRQRVNRMFARQEHDRIPRHETFWKDTITRWKTQGLAGDAATVLEMLGSDLHGLCWCWPQCFPGQEVRIQEDEQTYVVRDGHGKTVRYWKDRQGTPEHLGFDCDSPRKWHEVYKPALLDGGVQLDPHAVLRSFKRGRAANKWCHLSGVEPFEETRALMGDEITAIAMAENPEWVADVAKTFTDQVIRCFDACVAAGVEPDGLFIYGDMAYNHATFCSPAMYKELIWPQHKRLADWAHAHDARLIYHTDGCVSGVLDLWIEAGFDCFQPIEAKAGMDIRNLVPRYGDKLAFFGNVDVMVLMSNDLDAIEAEIKAKLAAGMAKRCYIYHSDHSIPPQVNWATYQHIIKLVDKYGRYK